MGDGEKVIVEKNFILFNFNRRDAQILAGGRMSLTPAFMTVE